MKRARPLTFAILLALSLAAVRCVPARCAPARRPGGSSLRGDARVRRIPSRGGGGIGAGLSHRFRRTPRGAVPGRAAAAAAQHDPAAGPYRWKLPDGIPGRAPPGPARLAGNRVPHRAGAHAPPHRVVRVPRAGVRAGRPRRPRGRAVGGGARHRLSLRSGLRLRAGPRRRATVPRPPAPAPSPTTCRARAGRRSRSRWEPARGSRSATTSAHGSR